MGVGLLISSFRFLGQVQKNRHTHRFLTVTGRKQGPNCSTHSLKDAHTLRFRCCVCVIVYLPTRIHMHRSGCNIESITGSLRAVGSVVYGDDVFRVRVRCIRWRVISAFHPSRSPWFTSHLTLLLHIGLRGTDGGVSSLSPYPLLNIAISFFPVLITHRLPLLPQIKLQTNASTQSFVEVFPPLERLRPQSSIYILHKDKITHKVEVIQNFILLC